MKFLCLAWHGISFIIFKHVTSACLLMVYCRTWADRNIPTSALLTFHSGQQGILISSEAKQMASLYVEMNLLVSFSACLTIRHHRCELIWWQVSSEGSHKLLTTWPRGVFRDPVPQVPKGSVLLPFQELPAVRWEALMALHGRACCPPAYSTVALGWVSLGKAES